MSRSTSSSCSRQLPRASAFPVRSTITAANAFLDAFAIDRASREAWTNRRHQLERLARHRHGGTRERGAATRPRTIVRGGASGSRRLLGRPRHWPHFRDDFAIDRHWLLSEHKIKDGMALLSGTTFVELARAAFCVGKDFGPIEINGSHVSYAVPGCGRHNAASGHSDRRRRRRERDNDAHRRR